MEPKRVATEIDRLTPVGMQWNVKTGPKWREGINSISLNPDVVLKTTARILELERSLAAESSL